MTMMRSPDWWNSGELTGDWGGPRNTLYDDGVSIFANYTNNIAGNPVGGKARVAPTAYPTRWLSASDPRDVLEVVADSRTSRDPNLVFFLQHAE